MTVRGRPPGPSGDGGPDEGPGRDGDSTPAPAEAELIAFPGQSKAQQRPREWLSDNRAMIVRRSLLATAVGGLVPLPVMDDYLATRVRAGMLIQIAERRRVDLLPSSAELLADPRDGTAARNATMTAATLLALKLAWKKFFVLVAAGRRAEEMATTFQVGTLFDHFCARIHLGSGLDREGAIRLRGAMQAAIRDTEHAAVVDVFREGGKTLARSFGEAPAWVTRRLQRAVEQFVASGGNPDAIPRDDELDPEQARWLDRAATHVEAGLSRLGGGYLESLLDHFERHLGQRQPR